MGRSIRAFAGGLILLLVFPIASYSQSPYTSVASGSWNDDNTWTGTGVPVAGDVVTILAAHTVTVAANEACASLTVTGAINIGNFTLDISTDLSGNGTLTMGSGTLNVADDNITFSGLFTYGTGTVNFNRNGGQNIPGFTYYNLTTSTGGIKLLLGSIVIKGDLNIGAASILDIDNANNYGITSEGNWLHTGTFEERQGTVTFSGGNIQNITGNPSETFYNLAINKSGGFTQPSAGTDIAVTNNFSINSGSTFSIQGNNFTVSGNSTISGLLEDNNTAGTNSFRHLICQAVQLTLQLPPALRL